jgi:hypothetical protein
MITAKNHLSVTFSLLSSCNDTPDVLTTYINYLN